MNQKIFENLAVHTFETTQDEARKLGAMMLFGEKYGDVVRVVDVDGFSTELCGGTHVRTTAEIGAFAILSEGSVGGGARRIEAVTSGEAYAVLHARAQEAEALRVELDELRKELKRKPQAADRAVEVEAQVTDIGGVNVIVQAVDGLDADGLLELSDRFKSRHAPAYVVLGSVEDGKVNLVATADGRPPSGSAPSTSSAALRRSWVVEGEGGRRWHGQAGRIPRSSVKRSPRPSDCLPRRSWQ